MAIMQKGVSRPVVRRDALATQSNSVGEKSRQNLKPTNPRLWHMLTVQARAKFVKYPSPAASSWVHKKYVLMGGKFIDTAEESRKKKAIDAAEKVSEAKRKHSKSREKK